MTIKTLFTAEVHTVGDREGSAKSSDSQLDRPAPYSKMTRGGIDASVALAVAA